MIVITAEMEISPISVTIIGYKSESVDWFLLRVTVVITVLKKDNIISATSSNFRI